MGKALAEAFAPAREVFQEIDDALSQKLSKLMWEGPESDLVLTENAQPAIMAASMAIIRTLQKESGLDLAKHARLVAGANDGCIGESSTDSKERRAGNDRPPRNR